MGPPTRVLDWPEPVDEAPTKRLNSAARMNNQAFLNDLQTRLVALLRASPAADVERNVKAMLTQTFQRLDLVTREEFDLQRELLARARARLEQLEARVAELEQRAAGSQTAGSQPD